MRRNFTYVKKTSLSPQEPIVFATAGTFNIAIPSGASKVLVECWAAGGGGNGGGRCTNCQGDTRPYYGGGGGSGAGYTKEYINVGSGTLTIIVGAGGVGSNRLARSSPVALSAGNGSPSSIGGTEVGVVGIGAGGYVLYGGIALPIATDKIAATAGTNGTNGKHWNDTLGDEDVPGYGGSLLDGYDRGNGGDGVSYTSNIAKGFDGDDAYIIIKFE